MKTEVKVKIVTFINKDNPQDTVSVVGDDDLTANSYEGQIFGEYCNVTGLYQLISYFGKAGHNVITTDFFYPVNY